MEFQRGENSEKSVELTIVSEQEHFVNEWTIVIDIHVVLTVKDSIVRTSNILVI